MLEIFDRVYAMLIILKFLLPSVVVCCCFFLYVSLCHLHIVAIRLNNKLKILIVWMDLLDTNVVYIQNFTTYTAQLYSTLSMQTSMWVSIEFPTMLVE